MPTSAMRAPVLAGQSMPYARADPEAKLFFTGTSDGAVIVSDCHPTKKRAPPGLEKFLSVASVMMAARARTSERARSARKPE